MSTTRPRSRSLVPTSSSRSLAATEGASLFKQYRTVLRSPMRLLVDDAVDPSPKSVADIQSEVDAQVLDSRKVSVRGVYTPHGTRAKQ